MLAPMRASLFAVLTACRTASPPQPQAPETTPNPAVATRSPRVACNPDPENDMDGVGEVACVRDAFEHRDYKTADARAAIVMKNFPYSRVAADAEEIRADILVANGKLVEAEAAYAAWLDLHRWKDRIEIVKKKWADADAQVRARTSR
jgi:hypothetical protein